MPRAVLRTPLPITPRTVYAAFVLEALISGFYVVITRSLAPIFFADYGLSLTQIVGLNLLANAVALIVALSVYTYGNALVKAKLRAKLALFHGLERVCWALIPVTAFYAPQALLVAYTAAVCATVPTGILINLAMINSVDSSTVKKLFAHRSALGAVSSVLGQVTMVFALALIATPMKYLYLYLLASGVGLIATLIVGVAPIRSVDSLTMETREEAMIKASTSFVFFVTLLASSSILGVIWGPHLIKDLSAPAYLAASLGLVQTIVSILASIFWQGRSYTAYRLAVIGISIAPLLAMIVPYPVLHLVIAALYAFANTGANFLASFIFADVSREIGVFKSSVLLTSAWILSQVIGLTPCYISLALGAPSWMVFALCMGFVIVSAFIAFTSLPEVALVPPHIANLYARNLYQVSIASYSFVMFTVKSYAILAVRFLALAFVILLLFVIYRVLYYLAMAG